MTDAPESAPHALPRRPLIVAAVVIGVIALVIAAIVWPGYKNADTPRTNISVWALNTRAAQYGRINTEIAELESISGVTRPTNLVQQGDDFAVFADGNRKVALIDPSVLPDLTEAETSAFSSTPENTRTVDVGGTLLLYTATDGAISTAPITDPSNATPIMVAPTGREGGGEDSDSRQSDQSGDEPEQVPLQVEAAAIGADNMIIAVTADADRKFTVVSVNPDTGKVKTISPGPAELPGPIQVSRSEGKWVILDTGTGDLWRQGNDNATRLELEGQAWLSPPDSTPLSIADANGLYTSDDATFTRTIDTGLASVAAPLRVVDGNLTGAWLAPADGGGVLWDAQNGRRNLDYGAQSLEGAPQPRILTNGTRTVLNDTGSGWVWLLPEGSLVPTSQDWLADAELEEHTTTAETEDVNEPRRPVAVDDHFGVRPGRETILPVLLNDYDANRDVLSVAPGSLEGLDPNFGVVSLANNGQQLLVSVSPEARGTATFSYRATDGTAPDGGLVSEPATVTLEVVPDSQNTAPFFAGEGVEDYLGQWPTPVVAPGGIASAQVLSNWIDPEGDPLFLADASTTSSAAQVLAQPDGTVTLHHLEGSGQNLDPVSVTVEIASSTGQSTTKELVFRVSQDPPIRFRSAVVTGVVGRTLQVDLEDHVEGGVGALRIAEMNVTEGEEGLTVSPSGLKFAATATTAGSFPIRVTVEDESGAATEQIVRLVIVEPEEATVSTAPLTVFVRPNEDVTADLLSAVDNPAGHVLMVKDLQLAPAEDAELTAEIVGQQLVHATGRTGNDQPGELGRGTYTISDGSGAPGTQTTGSVTFMLASNDSTAPIAADRWVRVQAGTQVDIPVLDWAIAPVGSQLAIDQSSIRQEEGRSGGLAFATPRVLRYLAPETPGEYSLTYTIFRLGDPQLRGTANVNVVVIPADADAVAKPVTLEGRVLAGGSTQIPLDLTEAQMRGESFALDRVQTQPTKGTAALTPDGQALLYTAHPNASGQDSFTYQVRSQSGKLETGSVNVGILNDIESPRPILYSRYVQTPVGGASNRVVVTPLDNALDPAGGNLTLDEVWPNAPAGTSEFDTAKKRILQVDTETGQVELAAADEVGTTSFFYKAHTERGDQASGLIVTKAVENPTRDLPVVEDTLITAETLSELPRGVDVLSERVTWVTGPASDLTMSLWEPDGHFQASGTQISGAIPDQATIVPFEVRGQSFSGEDATSYGFMKVPAKKEIPLAIRAGFVEPEVDEGDSVTVNLLEAIADPTGEGLQFDAAAVKTSGARAAARCSISDNTLTYDAGEGAPWRDACTIPVKTPQRDTFTFLNLAITVIPKDPQPILVPASVEASPGRGTVYYDLNGMVDWQGYRNGVADFEVRGNLELFDWSVTGAQLSLTAKDDAAPTRSETLSVSLRDYPDATPAMLVATVGPVAGQSPSAGTVRQSCTAKDGSTSCIIPVIGGSVSGQVNYLPATPLKLLPDSVVSPTNCPGVKFAYNSENSVVASWGADTPGKADCTGGFGVVDAQGRTSGTSGSGTILLDLQGLPAAPEVKWVAADNKSLTFQAATPTASYPAVESIAWSTAESSGTCKETTACAISVGEAELGREKPVQFTAVSAAGSSPATTVTAWTYQPPSKPMLTDWEPNPDGKTITVNGVAKVEDTSAVKVGPVVAKPGADGKFNATLEVPVTESAVTMMAEAKLTKPPDDVVIPTAGEATTTFTAFAIGAPAISITEPVVNGKSATASLHVDSWANAGNKGTQRKSELRCYVGDASEPSKTTTTGDLLKCEGDYGQSIRFEASGWAERGTSKFPVGTAAAREAKLEPVPVPVVNHGYTYSQTGQSRASCPQGRTCVQWYEPGELPSLGAAPDDVKACYQTSANGGECLTATNAVLLTQGSGAPLYVWNQTSSGTKSEVVEVPGPGAELSPGWANVLTGSGETCAEGLDPAAFSPFQSASNPEGTAGAPWGPFTFHRPDTSQASGNWEWKLTFPTEFRYNGQANLSWSCTPPPPPTPPGTGEPGTENGEGDDHTDTP